MQRPASCRSASTKSNVQEGGRSRSKPAAHSLLEQIDVVAMPSRRQLGAHQSDQVAERSERYLYRIEG